MTDDEKRLKKKKEYDRNWQIRNRERYRDYQREYKRRYRAKQKELNET